MALTLFQADDVYHLGPTSPTDYYATLSNYTSSLPSSALKLSLVDSLHTYASLPDKASAFSSLLDHKHIFQTDKLGRETDETRSWKTENPIWDYRLMDDREADEWVGHWFGGSEVEWTWRFMKVGVLKADFLRYLVMLVHGGVYSDSESLSFLLEIAHVLLD